MTRKTRTILFFICLILFLLIAPFIVFYSLGYRIDFENRKFTQTGAFYFKILPKGIEIYLDGKLAKETNFFFSSVLIEELLPKKYSIEIKKEGYHSWQKNLEIKEKQVTEAKNIILVPKDLNFTILGKEINNFYFSPDERKIILREPSEGPEGSSWALKLFDLEKNIKSDLIEAKEISKPEVDLLNLEFSPDSKILLKVGIGAEVKYFSLEIDKIPPVLTLNKDPSPPLKDIITYQTIGQDIYYLDNSGLLFKTNSSFEPQTKISETPFKVLPEREYKLRVFADSVFLQENQILYQLNPNSKSFEKFSESVKELVISPDLKKLAYFNDYEIWILFLESDLPTHHQKGDRIFLTRFSERINHIFWYTSHYLIFNTGNKIKIAEIDDRDRINIVDLIEFENPEIFFNQSNKKLYILSKGNFYSSERLLP